MNYQQLVLDHYDAEISEDHISHGLNLEEISTEDGYYFYALRESRDNYCMYYQREDAVYEEIRSQIESGGTVGCVDIDQFDWEEMYEEIKEEMLADKVEEIKTEVLALVKPIAKTFIEDRMFNEKVMDLLSSDPDDEESTNSQTNSYVNSVLDQLKFV